MLKEAWDSFKDNIKERATNPFLGTFILVWIVHNWRVVYAFFYFDKDWELAKKVDYFNKYWSDYSFIGNLIFVALITIGVLVTTYIFLAISRFLSNYFENSIIPFVYKISKGRTVTFETHQDSLIKIEKLNEKFEAERKAKNEALTERDELEKRLFQPTKEEVKQISNDDLQEIVDIAIKNLSKEGFEKTILDISKGIAFNSKNSFIDFLLKYGLIRLVSSSSGYSRYEFTQDGNEFQRKYFRSIEKA